MRPILQAWLTAAVLLIPSLRAAPEGPTAAGEPQPARAEPPTVPVVRFALGKTIVRGKVVGEDDQMLRVEGLDGSVIGYSKDTVRDIERAPMPAAQYHEMVGDYFLERASLAQGTPDDFVRARRAYQKSLSLRPTPEVTDKLAQVAGEREEWQREALRRKELEEAQARIELVKLQKETLEKELALQRETLAAVQEQARTLAQAQRRMDELARAVAFIQAQNRELQLKLRDMEDDISSKWGRISIYLKNVQVDRDGR